MPLLNRVYGGLILHTFLLSFCSIINIPHWVESVNCQNQRNQAINLVIYKEFYKENILKLHFRDGKLKKSWQMEEKY